MEMKKINDSSVPIKIDGVIEIDGGFDLEIKTKIINSKNSNLLFMVFAFQEITQDFGVDYETVIVLHYLYELDMFNIKIHVLKNKINLYDYINLGLIEKVYSIKNKNFYRLTKRSNDIIKRFSKVLENNSEILLKNRVYDMDSETIMKSVLSKVIK